MEESAKRRERLKAMRMEASQAAVYNDANSSPVSHGLSNPLIETAATDLGQVELCAPQRFDYYTDPMSAFSGNKRKNKVSNQTSEDYFTPPRQRSTKMTPSPAFQAQINYSSDQRMYQAQGVSHNSGPHGMPSSFGMQPGTPGVLNGAGGISGYCFPSNTPRGSNFSIPAFGQEGSPSFNFGQGRGHWFNNSPDLGSGCGGSPRPSFGWGSSPNFTPGQGREHWFSGLGPGSGRGGSPSHNSGQGRGLQFGNSPSHGSGRGGSPGFNSGRGRGRQLVNNTSPGSGWRGGGRGRGSPNHDSAQLRPDLYYNKSMVEDPWKFLKPIIWKRENIPSLKTPDSLKSWLPKSISMKGARVSEASNVSSSQPSLAEYLAASFKEAVNNNTVNDESCA